VRVDTLLEDTRERWRSQAQGEGLKIVIDCPGNIGLIRADMTRLQDVLDHLMRNALRQTPAGGVITLAAARGLGEVQIQVADTGRGIPFQVQAHIFDRFVGRDRGGPGLGLALVKALVELHGGWVALESEPGQGAVFTCHLPEIAGSGSRQKELGF
jgi:signal transduction histidine kinase